MKKKLILIILFLVIISLVTTLFFFKLNKNNREIIKKNNDIAIMVDGVEEIAFPSKQNYVFEKAVCNGEEVTASDTGTDNFNITIQNLDKTSNCVFYFIEDTFEYTETFTYTASAPSMTWTVPKTGTYKIELWGASGGNKGSYNGGSGAYTSGDINLSKNSELYLFLGENYTNFCYPISSCKQGTFNGGGGNGYYSYYSQGGGATDIRIVNTTSNIIWNESESLNSRIMVAAGGGGVSNRSSGYGVGNGGNAGGLTGYSGIANSTTNNGYQLCEMLGGNQIEGGKTYYQNFNYYAENGGFGIGGGHPNSINGLRETGGGAGYYGGSAGLSTNEINGTRYSCYESPGGGGSSYISGHKGCVAIVGSTASPSTPLTPRTGTGGVTCTTGINDNLCSVHYSGKVFTNTKMIDGAGLAWTNVVGEAEAMPNPLGGTYELNTGHTGNGYARITYNN